MRHDGRATSTATTPLSAPIPPRCSTAVCPVSLGGLAIPAALWRAITGTTRWVPTLGFTNGGCSSPYSRPSPARTRRAAGRSLQFGPAVEQSCLHYLKLRYRLLPYIYSYAWEASRTGVPLVRPLAFEFQDDAQSLATPGDQYLFGRELLVAPALHEGQTHRSVYFPPGRWFDWDTASNTRAVGLGLSPHRKTAFPLRCAPAQSSRWRPT